MPIGGYLDGGLARGLKKSTEMDERPLRLELEGLSSDLVFDHEHAGEAPKVIPMHAVKPKRKRGLWSELCPHLHVEDVYVELPADQLVDHDGTPFIKTGTESSEELVYEPGHCFVRRTIRQRYGRSDTGEKIVTTPVADKMVPRGGLSNETITAAVVHHAMDCLPFQRIAEIISRTAGTTVNRALITESCNAYAALAEPLLDAMWQQIGTTDVLHIDGSFLFHQDGKRPRKCSRKPMRSPMVNRLSCGGATMKHIKRPQILFWLSGDWRGMNGLMESTQQCQFNPCGACPCAAVFC